jgi:hypothetical protein
LQYDQVNLEWIGSVLPFSAKPADWVVNSRMIFALGTILRKYFTAGMYVSHEGRRYIQVRECEDVESETSAWQDLPAGAYVQSQPNAHLAIEPSIKIKQGIYALPEVARTCHSKNFRQRFGEDLCRQHAACFTLINNKYEDLLTGVYELTTSTESTRMLASQSFSDIITPHNRSMMFLDIAAWNQHDLRTQPIDAGALKDAVRQLYRSIGMAEPRFVIAPSPLSAALAAGIASVLLHPGDRLSEVDPTRSDASACKASGMAFTDDVYLFCAKRVATRVKSEHKNLKQAIQELNAEFHETTAVHTTYRLGWGWLNSAAASAPESVERATRTAVRSATGLETLDSDLVTSSESTGSTEPGETADYVPTTTLESNAFDSLAARSGRDFDDGKGRFSELLTGFARLWSRVDASLYVPDYLVGSSAQFETLPDALKQCFGAWRKASAGSAALLLHERFCLAADFPELLRFDERGRQHCAEGPAVKWRDGSVLYFWHGVRVTRQTIEAPDTLTPEQIFAESDIDLRRIMIDRFGLDRFISAVNAKPVHKDNHGTLFRFEPIDDEPLVVVRVKNSTPESDGTFKHYYLRVPPATQTAKAAVAWTFGINPDDYDPIVET